LSLCFLINKCTTLKYELRNKNCSRKALTTRNIFNLICLREQISIWYLHKLFKQEVVSSHTKQIHVTRSSLFIMLVYSNHPLLFSINLWTCINLLLGQTHLTSLNDFPWLETASKWCMNVMNKGYGRNWLWFIVLCESKNYQERLRKRMVSQN